MGSDYISYTAYIFFLLLVPLGLMFYLFKNNRRKKPKKQYINEITCGSLSVFMDKEKDITIIPFAIDKFGRGKALNKIFLVKYPYTSDELGKQIRKAMHFCAEGVPDTKDNLMQLLSSLNWKEYSEGKRNVSVCFKDGIGVVFNSTRRKHDGAYEFNHSGYESTLSSKANDADIGTFLLGVMKNSK